MSGEGIEPPYPVGQRVTVACHQPTVAFRSIKLNTILKIQVSLHEFAYLLIVNACKSRVGFEPTTVFTNGFADRSLATWVPTRAINQQKTPVNLLANRGLHSSVVKAL